MEYKYPLLIWVGVLVALIWSLDYWKIFQRAQIYFPGSGTQFSFKSFLRILLFIIGLTGWGFLSYSLMQPRIPQQVSPQNIEVNDVVLCIDVSRSMLAEDIKPTD